MRKQILLGLVGAAAGACGTIAFLAIVPIHKIPGWWWLLFVPVAWWLAVAVHELGHAASGLREGFVFNFLLIWPLHWKKADGQIRMVWKAGFNPLGGLASLFPSRMTPDLAARMFRFVAAGPLSSLVLAAAGLGFFLALRDPHQAMIVPFACAVISGVSLLLFAISIIPTTAGGMMTDGAWLRQLHRGGPAAESSLAFMVIAGLSQAGNVRPREWPEDVVRLATATGEGSTIGINARLLAYHYALDHGRQEEAGSLLDSVMAGINHIPAPLQNDFFVEKAWFEASIRGCAVEAGRALAQAQGGPFAEPHSRRRAEAAIAKLNGDSHAAAEIAREGLAHIQGARSKGIAVWERDVLSGYITS